MSKVKKAILALLILVCLEMSAERGYDYYYENFPVAKAGECLMLTGSSLKLKAQVLANNADMKASIVILEVGPGIEVIKMYSYAQLRQLKAERTPCE